MTGSIEGSEVVALSPSIRRVRQHNPGPYTGSGTNTHLVGTTALFVLDPGQAGDEAHVARIRDAVGTARVVAVIPSHGHDDHWGLAPRVAEVLDAPIWFHGTHPGFRTDRSLRDGDVIRADQTRLDVLLTPGHIPDHLCFHLRAEGALFPGDMVMAWSTSVIAPPEGDLTAYLESMERLAALPDVEILYPAHGEPIAEPGRRIRELIDHRHARTRQALEALAAGPSQIGALVARIYPDVDPKLHGAAAASLLAHLLALEADGTVARDGEHEVPDGPGVVWRLRSPDRARS